MPSRRLPSCSYRQMAGRAGRAGIDTLGECILVNQSIPQMDGEKLFVGGAEPVQSCLVDGKKGERVGAGGHVGGGVWGPGRGRHALHFSPSVPAWMDGCPPCLLAAPSVPRCAAHLPTMPPSAGMKRAMLEVVVSGAVVESADVERYIRCTLLAAMNDFQVRGVCMVVEASCSAPLGWVGARWEGGGVGFLAGRLVPGLSCVPPPPPFPSPSLPLTLQTVADTTRSALRWLGDPAHTFIFWDKVSSTFQPTPFGKAVLASGLPPELCLVLKVSEGSGAVRVLVGEEPPSMGPVRPEMVEWAALTGLLSRIARVTPCCAALHCAALRCLRASVGGPAAQKDLEKARESFVMTTELHLTYLCVPITESVGLATVHDWRSFQTMLGTLGVRGAGWGPRRPAALAAALR